MKKKLSLLGITLLCSSALATSFVTSFNAYAEETATSDSADTENLVAQLQAVINVAKPYVDYTKYEKGPVDTLKMYLEFAESDIANGYISETTLPGHIDSINTALELVKSSPITGSESSSTESSSSETESSSTESTGSSSSEELKPTINVSDKTMYVGDKLTKEDILNFATFKNTDGLKVGFHVLGNPIQVLKADLTLIEPGIHKIQYYVEGKTNSPKDYVAKKLITLTVKAKVTTDTTTSTTLSSSSDTGITNTSNSSGTYTKPTGITTPISSASTTAKLPQTGETNSPLLTVIGSMTLLVGGTYLLTLKRKKSN